MTNQEPKCITSACKHQLGWCSHTDNPHKRVFPDESVNQYYLIITSYRKTPPNFFEEVFYYFANMPIGRGSLLERVTNIPLEEVTAEVVPFTGIRNVSITPGIYLQSRKTHSDVSKSVITKCATLENVSPTSVNLESPSLQSTPCDSSMFDMFKYVKPRPRKSVRNKSGTLHSGRISPLSGRKYWLNPQDDSHCNDAFNTNNFPLHASCTGSWNHGVTWCDKIDDSNAYNMDAYNEVEKNFTYNANAEKTVTTDKDTVKKTDNEIINNVDNKYDNNMAEIVSSHIYEDFFDKMDTANICFLDSVNIPEKNVFYDSGDDEFHNTFADSIWKYDLDNENINKMASENFNIDIAAGGAFGADKEIVAANNIYCDDAIRKIFDENWNRSSKIVAVENVSLNLNRDVDEKAVKNVGYHNMNCDAGRKVTAYNCDGSNEDKKVTSHNCDGGNKAKNVTTHDCDANNHATVENVTLYNCGTGENTAENVSNYNLNCVAEKRRVKNAQHNWNRVIANKVARKATQYSWKHFSDKKTAKNFTHNAWNNVNDNKDGKNVTYFTLNEDTDKNAANNASQNTWNRDADKKAAKDVSQYTWNRDADKKAANNVSQNIWNRDVNKTAPHNVSQYTWNRDTDKKAAKNVSQNTWNGNADNKANVSQYTWNQNADKKAAKNVSQHLGNNVTHTWNQDVSKNASVYTWKRVTDNNNVPHKTTHHENVFHHSNVSNYNNNGFNESILGPWNPVNDNDAPKSASSTSIDFDDDVFANIQHFSNQSTTKSSHKNPKNSPKSWQN